MSRIVKGSRSLPEGADLAHLKKQAKELAAAVRRGDAEALQRARGVPGRRRTRARTAASGFALADAQRVIAREHGFASWAKLKRHVLAVDDADCEWLPLLPGRIVPFPGDETAAWVDRDIAPLSAALERDARVFCVARRDARAAGANTLAALYRIGVIAQVGEWRLITAFGRPALRLSFRGGERAELREIAEREGFPSARIRRLRPAAAAPERLRAGVDRVRRLLERIAELGGERGRLTPAALPSEADAARWLAIGADLCEPRVRQWLLATGDPARQLDRLAASLEEGVLGRLPHTSSQEDAQVPPSVPSTPACLVVLAAPQQPHLCGRPFALTAAVTSLGRDQGNDIALLSDTVSRRHCTIEHRDGRFVLLDRGSTNGCFANAEPARIDRRALEHGDRIALGDTIMAFLCGEGMESELRDLLDHLVEHDVLSELLNARAFSRGLARAVLGARSRAEPLSVLLADVDGLQRVNASHGGLAGNGLIRAVARTLRAELGPDALLARVGADCYGIALPGASRAEALSIGERLRAAVAAARHGIDGSELQVTVSIGCAELASTAGAEELMDEASRALRLAKQRGGNRVSGAQSEAA